MRLITNAYYYKSPIVAWRSYYYKEHLITYINREYKPG